MSFTLFFAAPTLLVTARTLGPTRSDTARTLGPIVSVIVSFTWRVIFARPDPSK
jgi:hypothetical protein